MITDKDYKTIKAISQKYQIKRVLIFGSSLESNRESKDIDLAIEGISPKDFYQYYGELLLLLSKPVDIIDLSIKSKFTDLIQKEGTLLYG